MNKSPKKPFYKRWYFWVLLLLLIGACNSTGDKTSPAAASSPMPRPSPTVIAAAAATPIPSPAPVSSSTPAPSPTPQLDDYILNTNTRKFHETYCSKAKNIKSSNRAEFTGTREELIQRGYEPCAVCNP